MASSNVIKKERIDRLLVRKGIVESREQAQALIAQGVVQVGGRPVLKSSIQVQTNAALHLADAKIPYVSRGGIKLEAALKAFDIDPSHKQVMDVGSSTGGFTDCLLQRGAAKVFAVDVGYGKLHTRLRNDSRVQALERCNVRYLTAEKLYAREAEWADLAVIDLSFISVRKVLPVIWEMLVDPREIIILVKPPFEAKREEVKRGGIMRDADIQIRILHEVAQTSESVGWNIVSACPSPILGRGGNMEFLLHGVSKSDQRESPAGLLQLVGKIVEEAHAQWDS